VAKAEWFSKLMLVLSAKTMLGRADAVEDPDLEEYLQSLILDPGYRSCRCDGMSFPHRPGSGSCRLRGTQLAKDLNALRPPRERARDRTCWCSAYPFPHRVGSGACLRHPDNPVSRDDAKMGRDQVKGQVFARKHQGA